MNKHKLNKILNCECVQLCLLVLNVSDICENVKVKDHGVPEATGGYYIETNNIA